MRSFRPFLILAAVAAVAMGAIGIAARAGEDPVPLYTGEDLDRMFGPAPSQPSNPVDKSRPEDWRWIEQFLDRQYARIDADRDYGLRDRSLDVAETRVAPRWNYYGGALAWGLGYPASTWWQTVSGHYAAAIGHEQRAGGYNRQTGVDRGRVQGHGPNLGHAPSQGHGHRHK